MLRLSGEAQTLAITLESSAEQEGTLAAFRDWSHFETFLTTHFGGVCPRLVSLRKLDGLTQGRRTVVEYVTEFLLRVSQIVDPRLSADNVVHRFQLGLSPAVMGKLSGTLALLRGAVTPEEWYTAAFQVDAVYQAHACGLLSRDHPGAVAPRADGAHCF
jgi:Retrotransposon gag protein